MESALLVNPDAADRATELRRQMAEIRCTLREHATDAAEGVRRHTNWRFLVSAYPWVSLSLAATLGYLLIPSRRQTHVDTQVVRQTIHEAGSSEAPTKNSMFWTFLGMSLPIIQGVVTRRAVAYLDGIVAGTKATSKNEPQANPRSTAKPR
jgi:hypothetical protein